MSKNPLFVDGEGIEPSSVLRLRVKDYSSPLHCHSRYPLASLPSSTQEPQNPLARIGKVFLGAAKHPISAPTALFYDLIILLSSVK